MVYIIFVVISLKYHEKILNSKWLLNQFLKYSMILTTLLFKLMLSINLLVT